MQKDVVVSMKLEILMVTRKMMMMLVCDPGSRCLTLRLLRRPVRPNAGTPAEVNLQATFTFLESRIAAGNVHIS
jgi:hypothetical protein